RQMSMNEIYRAGVSIPYPVEVTVATGDLVAFASGLVGDAVSGAKPPEAGDGSVATDRADGRSGCGAGADAAGVGGAASVTHHYRNVGETVTLAASGDKAGTIVKIQGTTVFVNLGR